jgi:hypothetical protein
MRKNNRIIAEVVLENIVVLCLMIAFSCYNGADFDKTVDDSGEEDKRTVQCQCTEIDFKWFESV